MPVPPDALERIGALLLDTVEDRQPTTLVHVVHDDDGEGFTLGTKRIHEPPHEWLFGFVAPPEWWALGALCSGRAFGPDQPDRRARVAILVDRDGNLAGGAIVDGGPTLDGAPGEGLVVDSLRRALGVPTAPPPTSLDELGGIPGVESWEHLRRMVASGQERFATTPRWLAEWMDDGMFARWVGGFYGDPYTRMHGRPRPSWAERRAEQRRHRRARAEAVTPPSYVGGMTPQHQSTHLHLLLDRSGSMEAIRDDVIGGFNQFLADQAAAGPDALVTLVQFDSQDPEEVVADAVPIAEMVPLDHTSFVPRGGTPLLDATGRMIVRASQRAEALASTGAPAEDIVVVTITDGHENQSQEWTRDQLVALIEARKANGWTFVFLSADLAAYDEAGGLGYDTRSVQRFAADSGGAALAFQSLSTATSARRAARTTSAPVDAGDFFGGEKTAEEDAHRRKRR